MKRTADFDDKGKYRYLLSREWDAQLPRVLYIMLNPSIADAEQDDQTIKRCIYFAQKHGYGTIEVVNLYAFISTDPKELGKVSDPIGRENDKYINDAAKRADKIVVAWGEKGFYNQRDKKVVKLLHEQDYSLFCLGVTKKEHHPRHPSRLSNDREYELFTTNEYIKKIYDRQIISVIPTVKRIILTSKEGYDSITGSDYHFHKDVMQDD